MSTATTPADRKSGGGGGGGVGEGDLASRPSESLAISERAREKARRPAARRGRDAPLTLGRADGIVGHGKSPARSAMTSSRGVLVVVVVRGSAAAALAWGLGGGAPREALAYKVRARVAPPSGQTAPAEASPPTPPRRLRAAAPLPGLPLVALAHATCADGGCLALRARCVPPTLDFG